MKLCYKYRGKHCMIQAWISNGKKGLQFLFKSFEGLMRGSIRGLAERAREIYVD